MKRVFLALALGGFALLPAYAQDMRLSPPGASETVQLAQVYRERRWERYPRRYGRPPYRCRWMTERRVRPNGTVVIRRVQRCW